MKAEVNMGLKQTTVRLIPETLGEKRMMDLMVFRTDKEPNHYEQTWEILGDAKFEGHHSNCKVSSITIKFPTRMEEIS